VHVADLLFLVHLVAVQNAAEDYAGAVKARPQRPADICNLRSQFATTPDAGTGVADKAIEAIVVEFVSRSPLEVQNQWQLTDVHSCSR
jgi:hypothetical protein